MDASTRQPCLDGTRVDLKKLLIDRLSCPSDSLHCEMVWLHGLAGSGKSTLLNSIAKHFRSLRQCGAFVFFDRSDPVNSDPSRVIPTLAYHLAQFSPPFAKKLDEQIQAQKDILRSSMDTQFGALLEEPSKAVAAVANHPLVVIVIDGLDECGTGESREGLLEVFSKRIQGLSPLFRILVASRNEKDIRSAFSQPHFNVERVPLRTDDDTTARDITEFFRQRLASIARDSELPPDWPGAGVIEQLTQCAGGLFIWASTAVGFIKGGLPDGRLRIILNTSTQGESLTKLDELYQLTLAHQFETFLARELETLRQILGAIVLARERLTDEVLCQLLGLEPSTVRGILSRLGSLLQWSTGEPIRVLHASFPDFLGDCGRCKDSRWFIDEPVHHCRLATACFVIMRDRLRFNICGLKTSYYKNKAINRINELVDENITTDIMYSCQYWAGHLDLGVTAMSNTDDFPGEMRIFLRERFLFWLEVFSLKDYLPSVPAILGVAGGWCKVLISWIYGE
jgi:hypothetical protein